MDAPPIQYARTDDGVNIAYWTLGEGFPLLTLNAPTLSHLGLEWQLPAWRSWYEQLASRFQVIRYSTRNAGLSDRNITDLSLNAHVSDVNAVVQAIGASRIGIVSGHFMTEVAIQYAAAAPETVVAIAALGVQSAGRAAAAAQGVFGIGERVWAETATRWFDPEENDPRETFVQLIIQSIDTHDRLRFFTALSEWDISNTLPEVSTPVQILYWPDHPLDNESDARELAGTIPNASLVPRPGVTMPIYDRARDEVLELVTSFIEDAAGIQPASSNQPDASSPSPFRTILFTDLESSTALTQAVGDAKAQDVLHGHNDAVRAALAAHEGEEVKHTGDGIMASFGSAVSAVEAAQQIQRDLAGGEIRVRVGLNAGEPIQEEGDLFGGSVQLAARVCDRAEPGQVLVSNVVRELCTGKLFQFADQGEATLKGFPEPVRLFAVEPPAATN